MYILKRMVHFCILVSFPPVLILHKWVTPSLEQRYTYFLIPIFTCFHQRRFPSNCLCVQFKILRLGGLCAIFIELRHSSKYQEIYRRLIANSAGHVEWGPVESVLVVNIRIIFIDQFKQFFVIGHMLGCFLRQTACQT